MQSYKGEEPEDWNDVQDDVSKNSAAEAKLYLAKKNRMKISAPSPQQSIPPPPLPPYSEYQNSQPNYNPSFQPNNHNHLPHQHPPQPSTPGHAPHQPPFYPTTSMPYQQRNPQAAAAAQMFMGGPGSIPRVHTNGPHRPQRLRMPAVMTTPSIGGVMAQNSGMQAPPGYYGPMGMGGGAPGMGGGVPGMGAGAPGPITQQPGVPGMPRMGQGMQMATYDNGWVVPSQTPVNCPPGLEYLAEVDQLLIHQQIEIFELLTGFETKNKYMIRNTLGQGVYFAAEESGCCNRQCCGPARAFDLNFYDHYGNVVMHMYRPLACAGCCCPCCLQSIEVSAPPGNVIGTIEQNWSVFFPKFSVKDVTGSTLLKIDGPFWTVSCCCKDVEFSIKSPNRKAEIGKITKQWSGFVQETFTDTDNFSVTFPIDMDITAKALLLSAVFLIDFMYYETNNN